LKDSFDTALLITHRDNTSPEFNFLQKGINNIVNFIIAIFRIEEAIICASKVAYLTQIIKQRDRISESHGKTRKMTSRFDKNFSDQGYRMNYLKLPGSGIPSLTNKIIKE